MAQTGLALCQTTVAAARRSAAARRRVRRRAPCRRRPTTARSLACRLLAGVDVDATPDHDQEQQPPPSRSTSKRARPPRCRRSGASRRMFSVRRMPRHRRRRARIPRARSRSGRTPPPPPPPPPPAPPPRPPRRRAGCSCSALVEVSSQPRSGDATNRPGRRPRPRSPRGPAPTSHPTGGASDGTTVQTLAMVVGAIFLAVGILGFIPGITTDYDELAFAGEDSTAELFGIFQVSILHNIVHLIFGIAGLALARTIDGARTYLIGGGVIYLALWLLGLVGGGDWIPATRPTTGSTSRSAPGWSRWASSPDGARPHDDRLTLGVEGRDRPPPPGATVDRRAFAATTFPCAAPPPSPLHSRPPAPSQRLRRRPSPTAVVARSPAVAAVAVHAYPSSQSIPPSGGIAGGGPAISLNTGSGEREGAWIVVTGAGTVAVRRRAGSLGPLAVELDFGHFVQFGRRLVPDALCPGTGRHARRSVEPAPLRPRDGAGGTGPGSTAGTIGSRRTARRSRSRSGEGPSRRRPAGRRRGWQHAHLVPHRPETYLNKADALYGFGSNQASGRRSTGRCSLARRLPHLAGVVGVRRAAEQSGYEGQTRGGGSTRRGT